MSGDAPRLLLAVSSHGFGHFAQSAAVINRLAERLPQLRLILRTNLPRGVLEGRLSHPFTLQVAADDFGVCNTSALDVDVPATARAYADLHADWDARVAEVSTAITAASPDLILADVPYLTLAAAARAGLPALALCCLNWADIYRHYCGHGGKEAVRVYRQMLDAYRSAQTFLRTAPGMPMSDLDNLRDIGPVMATGRVRRAELRRRLGLSPETRLVLVSMGGIPLRPPLERWPRLEGGRWLVPAQWQAQRDDMLPLEAAGLPFQDLLASCDLLFTKPGYGSFTEAAGSGVPVLYVRRGDWPEEPWLVRWLETHGRCAGIDRYSLEEGGFTTPLATLLEGGRHAPVMSDGTVEAAAILEERLVGQG